MNSKSVRDSNSFVTFGCIAVEFVTAIDLWHLDDRVSDMWMSSTRVCDICVIVFVTFEQTALEIVIFERESWWHLDERVRDMYVNSDRVRDGVCDIYKNSNGVDEIWMRELLVFG